MMCLLLFLYGLCNVGVALAYAVAGELHPQIYSGVSIAFTNMASILIGAALQPLMGWLVDTLLVRHSDKMAYYSAVWVLPVCLVISLLCTSFLRERKSEVVENE